MKSRLFACLAAGSLLLLSLGLSSRAAQKASQQAPSAKSNASATAKDPEPFPQVPRITAEDTERQSKEKGNVVLVDTDDPAAYDAEHIKGAVNIAYDPTVDARQQDQFLSALPGNKLIVFYCNCPHEEDSAPMVMEMWELGYDHDMVKALKGGLSRWEQLKYPLAGTDIDGNHSTAD